MLLTGRFALLTSASKLSGSALPVLKDKCHRRMVAFRSRLDRVKKSRLLATGSPDDSGREQAARMRTESSLAQQVRHDLLTGRDNVPNSDGKILSYLVLFNTQLFYIQSKIFLYSDDPWILLFPMIYKLPFIYVLSRRN
jgi:hypothetical protein